MNKSLIVDS